MKLKTQVIVRLKSGVLDVQGKAVENGLKGIGISNVANMRVGKSVEFEVEASTKETAQIEVERICKEVLINPVMETFEIRWI